MADSVSSELDQLRRENARLIGLLEAHGIAWTPRIMVATGLLVGEGFDQPPLDTLLLALPVSWKGTLQQYAGRLHRQQSGKTSVRIIDWLDLDHPITQRMWKRRLGG